MKGHFSDLVWIINFNYLKLNSKPQTSPFSSRVYFVKLSTKRRKINFVKVQLAQRYKMQKDVLSHLFFH